MRMMLKIMIPTEAGNRTIRDGSLPKILEGAVARLKAEASYFVAEDGVRTAMVFFDMHDSSDIPSIVEPLFMGIDAGSLKLRREGLHPAEGTDRVLAHLVGS
jgi:hypothetical protein